MDPAKMKIVYGYKSGGAINVAMEQLEVMGRWNFRSGYTGVRPTWIPEKMVFPIIATGPRDPELKGVPHLRDLLEPGSVGLKIYDVVDMDFSVGQGFYTAPGVPKNVVDILTKAFADMIADPETRTEIDRRRIEYSPLSAAEVRKVIEKGFEAATPDVVKGLLEIHTTKS